MMPIFYRNIDRQQQIIKKISPIFDKLARASIQHPLKKALSAESTYIFEHITRLKLIKSLLIKLKFNKGKPIKTKRINSSNFLMKNKSNAQDQRIIILALKLFKLMNKGLLSLNDQADHTNEPLVKTLIQQSIKENQDSINWLNNISSNVLAPEISNEQ